MKSNKIISVIIPTYNEENFLDECLASLLKQSYKPLQIIVVDDGSVDKTIKIAKKHKVKLLNQKHQGPGTARNFGAKHANGEILVFVDADMTFEKDFIRDLTLPILLKETIGTFSKNELNSNKDNVWSRCWNINRNWPIDRQVPPNYPPTAPVYRAILKKEFDKVGGFDTNGQYTDDWSLSRKLGVDSTVATGATYYHVNPASLSDAWSQARWIGKNEFISGTILRRIKSLILYNPVFSTLIGTYKSLIFKEPKFIIFKINYDAAILLSCLESFTKVKKYK